MRIIAIANKYKKRPSEILGEHDPYLAFCIDDVCMFIEMQRYIEDGKYKWEHEPQWERKEKKVKSKTSNSESIEKMKSILCRVRN